MSLKLCKRINLKPFQKTPQRDKSYQEFGNLLGK